MDLVVVAPAPWLTARSLLLNTEAYLAGIPDYGDQVLLIAAEPVLGGALERGQISHDGGQSWHHHERMNAARL